MTQPVDKFNRQSNFDTNTGLLDIATGNNRAPNVDNTYGNVDPRVGFSYSPNNGKTAIRGAFGITTFTANYGGIGGSLERNFPFFEQYSVTQSTAYTPWATMGAPRLSTRLTRASITVCLLSCRFLLPRQLPRNPTRAFR